MHYTSCYIRILLDHFLEGVFLTCTSQKFGDAFNLAIWRSADKTPNLEPPITAVYILLRNQSFAFIVIVRFWAAIYRQIFCLSIFPSLWQYYCKLRVWTWLMTFVLIWGDVYMPCWPIKICLLGPKGLSKKVGRYARLIVVYSLFILKMVMCTVYFSFLLLTDLIVHAQ